MASTSRVRLAWLFLGGVYLASCVGESPENEIPAPDLSRIFIYFPGNTEAGIGLVQGRGLSDAVPPQASHVVITDFPSGREVVETVNDDGSFEFAINALAGNVLEITGATSRSAAVRGAPAYVKVPALVVRGGDFVCYLETNTCEKASDIEKDGFMPGMATPGVQTCTTDAECGIFENEYLKLSPEQITVTAPSAGGTIDVSGTVGPNLLVSLANVGHSSVGGVDPGVRINQITDDLGRFRISKLRAEGDHELVIQLEDLGGYRSPKMSVLVPDAQLTEVDVMGIFPVQPLTNGQPGKVGIEVSLGGVDRRGICPDGNSDLELCLNGGLEHSMVSLVDFTIDKESIIPTQASTTAQAKSDRGIEGNIRTGPVDIVVVLDMSAAMEVKDGTDPFRFEAVKNYVRYLRRRDRVALVTFGGTNQAHLNSSFVSFSQRNQFYETIDQLRAQGASGEGTLLDGLETAGMLLQQSRPAERRLNSARVVVIAAQVIDEADLTPEELQPRLEAIGDIFYPNSSIGFAGHRIDIVGVAMETQGNTKNFERVEETANLSFGTLVDLPNSEGIEQTLSDLRAKQVGAFMLLYDIPEIPVNAGKQGDVEFNFRVTLNGIEAQTSYRGPLRIARSQN